MVDQNYGNIKKKYKCERNAVLAQNLMLKTVLMRNMFVCPGSKSDLSELTSKAIILWAKCY
jgi:hypothetical protein